VNARHSTACDPAPLDADGFAALMAALSPFESRPDIAVAVSGGSDSLALCLLADRWARQRGGHAVALTVDHGLRPASAAEACLVGTWLASLGIAHVILPWRGEKPSAGVQAAARTARYALLEAWCRDAGILHLLLGHTKDDQEETVFLRLTHATGVEGAAGMSAVVEREHVRLLRPCLGIRRDRLRATLVAAGQEWIEDPSNRDRRFARVRVRETLDSVGRERTALSNVRADFGRARLTFEAVTAAVLARYSRLYPAGYAVLDAAAWRGLPEPLAVAVLDRLCTSIGGRTVPPRDAVVRAAVAGLRKSDGAHAATLAGCRLTRTSSGLLVSREARHLPGPLLLEAGRQTTWDGRFVVTVAKEHAAVRPLRLDYLGRAGWTEVAANAPALRRRVPAAVREMLPAIWDDDGVLRVPHLPYNRKSFGNGMTGASENTLKVVFAPALSLSGNGFRLAPEAVDTI
jgi:tRNA(Ile)-lysidine synthase